jgi:hypothetical protein
VILTTSFSGMGHNGQLARSADMGAPMRDGKYDLGKSWIGEEYEKDIVKKETDPETGVETSLKTGEKETKYRYFEDLIVKQFLTPLPVRWSTPGKRKVLSVACGELHLVVVARMDGSFESDVYSAGHNAFGQQAMDPDSIREIHELTPVSFATSCDPNATVANSNHAVD